MKWVISIGFALVLIGGVLWWGGGDTNNTLLFDDDECVDGNGLDIYFDEKDIDHIQDVTWVGDVDYSYVIAKADIDQCHQPTEYTIWSDGSSRDVTNDEFDEHIKTYNTQCNGCLHVLRFGFPYFGEIERVE